MKIWTKSRFLNILFFRTVIRFQHNNFMLSYNQKKQRGGGYDVQRSKRDLCFAKGKIFDGLLFAKDSDIIILTFINKSPAKQSSKATILIKSTIWERLKVRIWLYH